MLNRDLVEKALLVNVCREHNFEILIRNSINESFFTITNKKMYQYVREYDLRGEFPDIKIMCFKFNIDDITFSDIIQITDLQGLCDSLVELHLKESVIYKVGQLNEYSKELEEEPAKYIKRIGNVYDDLKILSYKSRSVDLFEDMDNILEIDPNDVISTGFKELDEILIGWKRGEELAVFMARTGQRKVLDGFKVCTSSCNGR